MVRVKVRITFRKDGALRLVSHHDLLRCFERMLRRAALPFRTTEGFNPKPRLVFALPLPLGAVGHREIVDLELGEDLTADEVRERITRQAPPGLEVLDVCRIDPKVKAHVRRAVYRVALPPERPADLPERLAALLAAPECWVERSRPQPRLLDLRPYLGGLRLVDDALEMDLEVTPGGTARPEEVLQLLGLREMIDAGVVYERLRLELQEDVAVAHAGGEA